MRSKYCLLVLLRGIGRKSSRSTQLSRGSGSCEAICELFRTRVAVSLHRLRINLAYKGPTSASSISDLSSSIACRVDAFRARTVHG